MTSKRLGQIFDSIKDASIHVSETMSQLDLASVNPSTLRKLIPGGENLSDTRIKITVHMIRVGALLNQPSAEALLDAAGECRALASLFEQASVEDF